MSICLIINLLYLKLHEYTAFTYVTKLFVNFYETIRQIDTCKMTS